MKRNAKQARHTGSSVLGFELWPVFCLVVVVCLFGFIRFRLRDFPLERDEGEYAYAAQLILHGIAPYKLCYTMKLPGTALAYALALSIFGQTAAGVHLGLLLINSATTTLIYVLASSLLDRWSGMIAAATYGLLSIEPSVLGLAGHATQFAVLPAVAGILILLKALRTGREWWFFCSGILFGIAFLMKQPGIFFLGFGAVYVVQQSWKEIEIFALPRRLLTLSLGAIFPFAVTCFILYLAGVFPQFWFWTFSYAREYGTIEQLSDGLSSFWQTAADVIGPTAGIWIIAAGSVFAFIWDSEARKQAPFLLGLFLFSFAAICPGLYFRPHYFVLLLPIVSLLCALSIWSVAKALRGMSGNNMAAAGPFLLFALLIGSCILRQREFFFKTDPYAACREIYGINPFPESLEIARFLKSRARAGDRVAVMGSEPQIYFYSGLESATGYVYMYPLMENQKFASTMQEQLASEVENASPEFVVSIGVVTSWMPRPDSNTFIWGWSDRFVKGRYNLVGAVEITKDWTHYYWDNLESLKGESLNRILIYQRKKQ